jgi:hypothetical protein
MKAKFNSKYKDSSSTDLKISKNESINKDSKLSKTDRFYVSNLKRIISITYPGMKNPKFSSKSFHKIKCFSASSYKGLVRNYNEDRIKIIQKVIKPDLKGDQSWPNISYFGIFDGHGGKKCSNFLKENLHHIVIDLK